MFQCDCGDKLQLAPAPLKQRSHRSIAIAVVLLAIGGCKDGEGGGIIVVPAPLPTPSPTPVPTPTPTPMPTPTPSPGTQQIAFDFQQGLQGWRPIFADYRADLAANFEFRAGYEAVPQGLTGRNGLLLSSSNQSDDVFMGAYRHIGNLRPHTRYRIDATVTFASRVGTGCAGIGGAPGESVYVKAGASTVLPEPNRTGYVRLPLDKGEQSQGGRDMVVIGDIATAENSNCNTGLSRYVQKTLTTGTRSPLVTSDANGRLWLVLGTDSGFEGRTSIYLLEGNFVLTPT